MPALPRTPAERPEMVNIWQVLDFVESASPVCPRNPRISMPEMQKETRSHRVHTMNILNRRAREKQLWIGKVEVRPMKGSTVLGDSAGAFVNLVTWSHDPEEYRRNADLVLGELGLFIV